MLWVCWLVQKQGRHKYSSSERLFTQPMTWQRLPALQQFYFKLQRKHCYQHHDTHMTWLRKGRALCVGSSVYPSSPFFSTPQIGSHSETQKVTGFTESSPRQCSPSPTGSRPAPPINTAGWGRAKRPCIPPHGKGSIFICLIVHKIPRIERRKKKK